MRALVESHAFAVCRVVSDVPGQELLSFRTPISAVLRALRVVGGRGPDDPTYLHLYYR